MHLEKSLVANFGPVSHLFTGKSADHAVTPHWFVVSVFVFQCFFAISSVCLL